ncbi:hypothetical protein F4677DRAFT_338515 [Hypoxylon crocopeplum]|nr:hypothetical protein F4677DRAFT_338515 [Hypoxylon crocopeplum]
MDYVPLAPIPQPVFGQGFRYNGRLTVKGIPRLEPSEVKRLIFEPEGASPEQLHELRNETFRVVTKTWLEAQIRHYGIPLASADAPKDELRELLRRESLKPDFTDIKRQFNAFFPGQFEKMKADWEAQCAAYKDSCFTGRRQADFDNLATLEEKLNFDIDMFLEAYYSDQETLPDPMPFRGINFEIVMKAMAKVSGLYIQKVGTDFQKMLWVGWDKKRVKQACKEYAELAKDNAAARRLLKQQGRALAHEKRLDRAMQWRLEPHRDYMARINRSRGIEGSYIIEATLLGAPREESKTAREWMDVRNTTFPSVFEATFNFTVVEGVMILSQNDADIQTYINQFEPPSKVQATTTNNRDMNLGGPQPGSKRKRKQNSDGWLSRANGSSSGPDPKRIRSDVPAVLEGCTRYHTRWRGTIVTPAIHMGAEPGRENGENEGWIDFLESSKAQFFAHCKVPLLTGVIQGYKVSDQAKFKASKWETRPKASDAYTWLYGKGSC